MNESIKQLAESIVESLDNNEFEGTYEAENPFEINGKEYEDAIFVWEADSIGDKMIISINEASGFTADDNYKEEKDITFNLKELNNLVNDML